MFADGFIGHLLWQLNALQFRRMDFEEFCAATLSVHQLEALDRWEHHARCAYELFESNGSRAIVIEELASVRVAYYILDLCIASLSLLHFRSSISLYFLLLPVSCFLLIST